MFRTVLLSIISIFTVHSAMVYVIQVCRQLSSGTRIELQFHPGPAVKLVHLVGFITKKFVKMHGHMNVKKCTILLYSSLNMLRSMMFRTEENHVSDIIIYDVFCNS
jgi:hypothetical protein